jgi:hypothetical protein
LKLASELDKPTGADIAATRRRKLEDLDQVKSLVRGSVEIVEFLWI